MLKHHEQPRSGTSVVSAEVLLACGIFVKTQNSCKYGANACLGSMHSVSQKHIQPSLHGRFAYCLTAVDRFCGYAMAGSRSPVHYV